MTLTSAEETTIKRVVHRLGPIGPVIDQLSAFREEKRALEAKIKDIEEKYSTLEEELMTKMDAEGTRTGSGKRASASITTNVVGNVTDWELVHAFIKKKGYQHLYFKRLSDPALRELFDKGVKVPGCEPFTKRKLNLRVIP